MSTTLDEAYRYCQDYTKHRTTSFYYAFASLPASQRRAIYACYTFAGQCDDIADQVERPLEEKLALLEGKRQQLDRCYAGRPQGPAEVALADTLARFPVPREYLDDLVRGVEMDLTINRYATFDDLYCYCYRVASTVGLVCIHIFGHRHPVAKEYAEAMGVALQLTNIMRDVKEDAAWGRIYLPLEDMARFGYSEEDLFRHTYNDAFRQLMALQTQRAEDYYRTGRKLLPLMASLRGRMCVNGLQGVYYELLRQIRRHDYNVYAVRVTVPKAQRLPLLIKLWLRCLLPIASPRPESSSSAAA